MLLSDPPDVILADGGRGTQYRFLAGAIALSIVTILALILIENALVLAYVPGVPRFATDFSPAFLQRKLQSIAGKSKEIVFMGDSALWGYALPSDTSAIAILIKEGCPCVNLSFKAGSPANDYALARLFDRYGVRPKLAVLEINQRAFNRADQSYKNLHPSVASLAAPILTPEDRATLGQTQAPGGLSEPVDRLLSKVSAAYAMRADLRALIFGDTDVLPKEPPKADDFLGTYDLAPLDANNVGVRYLTKAVKVLRNLGIPTIAFLTPTNHTLLHEYIDVPAYQANLNYLKNLLEREGVRVIDLDSAFPAGLFIDNAHLTPEGQRRLAAVLAREIPELDVKP